jgi:hypothetical protein
MSQLMQSLTPILAAAIVAAIVWFLREQSTRAAMIRTRQLVQASAFLEIHASVLELILDDPDAPIELKKLVISVSDAMSDRNIVEKLAEWASTRALAQPVDTEESRAIDGILTPLWINRPDLAANFAKVVVTAVTGASLRWPESAALFEQVFPRLMITPKCEVAIAATATSMRSLGPFSLRPTASAMA